MSRKEIQNLLQMCSLHLGSHASVLHSHALLFLVLVTDSDSHVAYLDLESLTSVFSTFGHPTIAL